jgi:hypothetical protein
MKIVTTVLPLDELKQLSNVAFGNLVKAVVDVETETLALDAELHADLEMLLLESGSVQNDLWGINLYPELQGDEMVEFDSMINLRPAQGNRSRGVENETMRKRILEIVAKRIRL